MQARKPAVAGQFYESGADACRAEIQASLAAGSLKQDIPSRIVAGIVPHAGWVFSGDLAALVFSAIKQARERVDTFVIFGAAHRYMGSGPIVYDKGSWLTPLGEIAIDEQLAAAIVETGAASADMPGHAGEHSIEVQVPFIQHLFEQAQIVPIIVPPNRAGARLGDSVARIISEQSEKTIVCIASTDLTHYGPRYGFYPLGADPDGLKWATEVNDAEFIDLALKMEPEKLLKCALENCSACGPGAAAAAVEAAKKLGKTQGLLLGHTDSNEIMQRKFRQSSQESVGYAAIVY